MTNETQTRTNSRTGNLVLQLLDLDPQNPLSMREIERTELGLYHLGIRPSESAKSALKAAAKIVESYFPSYKHSN